MTNLVSELRDDASLPQAYVRMREAADEIERLQSKVDALMLEYCPDEMSPEQKENWARHQVPVEPSGEQS